LWQVGLPRLAGGAGWEGRGMSLQAGSGQHAWSRNTAVQLLLQGSVHTI